jgi:RNA polymerase sigma factor (sigma-70 family)
VTSLTPADEADLVRRAQAGDRNAFGSIVAAYQAPALRLATIVSGDSTEAYDIVQEAFVRAYLALPGIRASDSLRAWLLRIVANQAKNVRRGRGRRDARWQRQTMLRMAETASTDDLALGAVEAERLLHAIGGLSPADRNVLACRYFAELSERETADVLGVASGTVKSRTARALSRLRSKMETPVEVGGGGSG